MEKGEDLKPKNRDNMSSNPFFKIGISTSLHSEFEGEYCTSDIEVKTLFPKWLHNSVFKLLLLFSYFYFVFSPLINNENVNEKENGEFGIEVCAH